MDRIVPQYHINEAIDSEVWDKYVGNSFFHRFEWFNIIKNAYGLEPFFILLEEGEDFALLPSFKLRKKYISLPYLYVSGYLGSSAKTIAKLKKYIQEKGIKLQYKVLHEVGESPSQMTSIVRADNYDFLWRALSSNMRNQIRKSRRFSFESKIEDHVENFYFVMSKRMHSLGTPMHRKSFFTQILQKFKQAFVYTAFDENEPIASMLCFVGVDSLNYKEETLYIYWAATLKEYDRKYINYFLYDQCFQYCYSQYNNLKFIDLGTSLIDSPPFRFKQKWKPNNYEVRKIGAGEEKNYKENKKLVFVSNQWKKLPYKFTLLIGPTIRKYLT